MCLLLHPVRALRLLRLNHLYQPLSLRQRRRKRREMRATALTRISSIHFVYLRSSSNPSTILILSMQPDDYVQPAFVSYCRFCVQLS